MSQAWRRRNSLSKLTVERLEDRTLLDAGALDPTFGTGGLVTTDFGQSAETAQAVAVQPDGKLVVAGVSQVPSRSRNEFGMARYIAAGALDPTFGTGGRVTASDFIGGAACAPAGRQDPGGWRCERQLGRGPLQRGW